MDEKLSQPDTSLFVSEQDSLPAGSDMGKERTGNDLYYSVAIVIGIVVILLVLFNNRTK